MRWLVAVALAVLLSGCICTPPSEDAIPQPTSTIRTSATTLPTTESPTTAQTAKDGLEAAKQKILVLRPDAIIVGVSGSADKSGQSTQWEYQYDSLKGKKGYVVDSSGQIRDKPYSFKAALGEDWVDSPKAASVCGVEAGEFSLEVQDGKTVWTVISDDKTCSVDAASGTIIGGDE